MFFNSAVLIETLTFAHSQGSLSKVRAHWQKYKEDCSEAQLHYKLLYVIVLLVGYSGLYLYFALIWPWMLIDGLLLQLRIWRRKEALVDEELVQEMRSQRSFMWVVTLFVGSALLMAASAYLSWTI